MVLTALTAASAAPLAWVVVGTAGRVVDSPAVAKLLERLRGKLGAAVRSQLHRDALVRHPLFQKVDDLQLRSRTTASTDGRPAGESIGVDEKLLSTELK